MGRKGLFVTPDIHRLHLADGEWVDVKTKLTFGESMKLSGAGFTGVKNSGGAQELTIDWELYQIERLAMWLDDWSFRDDDDKPVRLSRNAIANLDPEVAEEITAALDAYLAEQEELKNARRRERSEGSSSQPASGSDAPVESSKRSSSKRT